MQTNNKTIAKNTIALYIRMAITMVVSFLTVRITLHILGSEDYGLNNLVGSIVAMFSFINGSMGTAVQRFYSYEIGQNNEERLAKVFGVGVYLHLCVAFVTMVFGEIFAIFFLSYLNIPSERMIAAHVVFQITLWSLILNILSVPYAAMLRAREDFTKFASLDIMQAFGNLVVLFLLYIISFDKLITLSLLNFSITLLYISGLVILARQYPETKFRIDRDRKYIREMTGFISMLLFTVLFSILRDKGIIVLINLFFGLAVNAAYAIASQIMHLASNFAMNFKQAVVPQIMSAYSAGDYTRMNALIISGSKITFVMLLLITIPIIFEPYYVLDIVLTDVPEYASTFTALVLINVNISSFSYFLYQGIHATGNIKGLQICRSIIFFVNILLVYILFKLEYGCYFAVYITIFCSILQCLIDLFFAHKILEFNISDFFMNVIAKGGLIILLLIILAYPFFIMPEGFIRFLLRTIFSLFVIMCSSYWLFFNSSERTFFKNAVSKIIKR